MMNYTFRVGNFYIFLEPLANSENSLAKLWAQKKEWIKEENLVKLSQLRKGKKSDLLWLSNLSLFSVKVIVSLRVKSLIK